MSYPSAPHNRLIVNGVDLYTEYGLVLADGYILEPPAPKTYVVNIPGGNGKIDLTDALTGEASYDNRKQEFTFYIINTNEFESVKRRISNFLHGREFDYRMTMDPGYTYHGRFTVSSYEHQAYGNGILGTIKITIDADPFKYLDPKVYGVDGVGGATVIFEGGRKTVRPVIEAPVNIKIISGRKVINLPAGTWQVNDLMFVTGDNEIYFNSFPIHNLTWENVSDNNITWGQLKTDKLYKWYRSNGDGTYALNTWDTIYSSTWSSLASKTWSEISRIHSSVEDVDNIYVQYEVGDL